MMSKKVYYEEKRKAMGRLCNANFSAKTDSGSFFAREYNAETYDVFVGRYMALAWKCCPFEYGGSGEFVKLRDERTGDLIFKHIVASASNSQKLTLPTLKEIRAFLKEYREEHRGERGIPEPKYDFGEGRPMVNAKWLKDILVVLSDYDDEVMWGSFENITSPIYIEKEDESGCAILCPIVKRDTSKTGGK